MLDTRRGSIAPGHSAAAIREPVDDGVDRLLPGVSGTPDPLLDGNMVGRAWKDLLDRRRPVGAALWAVVMLQAWRARWAS